MRSFLETQILRTLSTVCQIIKREEDASVYQFRDDEHRDSSVTTLLESVCALLKQNTSKTVMLPSLPAMDNYIVSEELFVCVAEVAFLAKRYDISSQWLDYFFSHKPFEKTEHYVRALLCQSRIRYESLQPVHADQVVKLSVDCLNIILHAVKICQSDLKRFSFLIHEASVQYWNIANRLFRFGSREVLIDSLSSMSQVLNDIDDDICWRILFLINLAICYDEIEKIDSAISCINSANELITKHSQRTVESEDLKSYLTDEIFRLQIHIGRKNSKRVSQPLLTTNNNRHRCILHLQMVKSGIVTDKEQISKELTECFHILNSSSCQALDSEKLEKKQRPSSSKKKDIKELKGSFKAQSHSSPKYSDDILYLFGELGIVCLCYAPSLLDVARSCYKTSSRSSTLESRILSEYIRGYLLICEVQNHERDKLTEKMITIRLKAMNIVEKAIDSSRRLISHLADHRNAMIGGKLTVDGCILLWNICLPLLQTNLRTKVLASLNKIADSLEGINSNMYELRVAVHFEIGKCYIIRDILAKAEKNVNSAISMDYRAEMLFDEEVRNFKMERPLDKYLVPMKYKLELQTTLYELPERYEDQAFLLIQQANISQSLKIRKNLLEKVVTLLEEASEKNISPDSILSIRELWFETLKTAWKEDSMRIVYIAQKACSYLIKKEQSQENASKEMIIEEAIACFIFAESCILSLNEETLSIDLPLREGSGVTSDKMKIIIEAQFSILDSIYRGLELGNQILQDWIILNGCIYLWNYHLTVYQDYKMFFPYIRILRYCYECLMQVHSRVLETKSSYSHDAIHPHHLILVRISYAYVCALIQQHFLEDGDISPFSDVTSARNWQQYVNLYSLPYKDITANPFTQTRKPTSSKERSNSRSVSRSSNNSKKSSLPEAISVCNRVIPIFALQSMRLKSPKQTERSPSKQNTEEFDSNQTTIMLVKDLVYLRCTLLKLEQGASKGSLVVPPLTTNPVERIMTNIALISNPTVLQIEKEKLLSETYFLMKQLKAPIPEFCAKLSELSLDSGNNSIVFDISSLCETSLPQSLMGLDYSFETSSEISERQWRWYSLVSYYCGRAIASQTLTDPFSETNYVSSALSKYTLAMKFASFAKERNVGIMIADSCLQLVRPIMVLALRSSAKQFYCQVLMRPLECVLYFASQTITDLYVRKDTLNVNNSTTASNIIEQLYHILFTCLRECREFSRALSIVKQSVSHLPITHHKRSWQIDIEFRCLLGQSIQASLSRVKGYDKYSQALVWTTIGHCSRELSEKKDAFKQAVDTIPRNDSSRVDYMVEYALWMYMNNYSAQESAVILYEANVILLKADKVVRDTQRMLLLDTSKTTSNSSSEASTLDCDSYKTQSLKEDDRLVVAEHMQQIIVVNYALALVAQNPKESINYCLSAHAHATKLLRSAIHISFICTHVFNIPTNTKEPEKVPTSLHDWIGYSLSSNVRALWKSTDLKLSKKETIVPLSGEMSGEIWEVFSIFTQASESSCRALFSSRTINRQSIRNPQYLLTILQLLLRSLLREGFVIHCLPILHLMLVIAEDIMEEDSTTCLVNLYFSHIYGILGLSDYSEEYRRKAGSLQIDTSILRQMHRDHYVMNEMPTIPTNVSEFKDCSCLSMFINGFVPLRTIWIQQASLLIDGNVGILNASELTLAAPLLKEALIDARVSKDWLGCSRCYYLLSRLSYLHGQPQKALLLLKKSLHLHETETLDATFEVNTTLENYRETLVSMIAILLEDSKEQETVFEVMNNSTQILVAMMKSSKRKNTQLHITLEFAHLQNSYGEILLEQAHSLRGRRELGSTIVQLFRDSISKMDAIGYRGLLYVRCMYNLIRSSLIYANRKSSSITEYLYNIWDLVSSAKLACEQLTAETIPTELDPSICPGLETILIYAKVLLLHGHVDLLLQEVELRDLLLSKQHDFLTSLNLVQDESKLVIDYIQDLETSKVDKNRLMSSLLQRVENAFSMSSSVLKTAYSPLIQAESKFYIGKSLHSKIKTRKKISEIYGPLTDKNEDQVEIIQEMITTLKSCIVDSLNLLHSGQYYDQALRLTSLASRELFLYYLTEEEQTSASSYLLLCQSSLCVLENLQTLQQYSFQECVDWCLLRLQKKCCSVGQWQRVKEIHSKLMEISPSFQNLIAHIVQDSPLLSPLTIPSARDTCLLVLLSLTEDMTDNLGFLISDTIVEPYLYVCMIQNPVSDSEPRAVVTRRVDVNVEDMDLMTRNKVTRNDNHWNSRIEATERVMSSIINQFSELAKPTPSLRKLVIVTHNDKLLSAPFESLNLFQDTYSSLDTEQPVAGFKCVTRDFSVATFIQRMETYAREKGMSSGSSSTKKRVKTPGTSKPNTSRKDVAANVPQVEVDFQVDWNHLFYIIDPLDEDQRNVKKANRSTLSSQFEELMHEFETVAESWKGIKGSSGSDLQPNLADLHALLNEMQEEKDRVVFVTQCLNQFVPSVIPKLEHICNLKLQNVNLAIIMDRLEALRDEEIENGNIILAKLMTLRGVSTVVVNQHCVDQEQVNVLIRVLRLAISHSLANKQAKANISSRKTPAATKTAAKKKEEISQNPSTPPQPTLTGVIAESLFQVRNSLEGYSVNAIVFGIP